MAKAAWAKGKWAGKPLTRDQTKAQRWWQRATADESKLAEALGQTIIGLDLAAMHRALDRRLSAIAEGRRRAKELFPDVAESSTIASCKIDL